jgi:hypothetical protein
MMSLFYITNDDIIYKQGKIKNQASDEFILPTIQTLSEQQLRSPACLRDTSNNEDQRTQARWFARVAVTKGGAAGKGPDPPEPPSLDELDAGGSSSSNALGEDWDDKEAEAKPRMSFAKMQVPANMKEAYLLTDSDFLSNILEQEDETPTTSLMSESIVSDTPPPSAPISTGEEEGETDSQHSLSRGPSSRSGSRKNTGLRASASRAALEEARARSLSLGGDSVSNSPSVRSTSSKTRKSVK